MRSGIVFLAATFLLGLPAALLAQVQVTGRITGRVTDSSGAAVPRASVEVASPALMAPRSVTTQADGTYLFDLLPAGTYDLTVKGTGFKAFERQGLVISAGFTATVNVALQVGTVTQTVTVSGAAPVVDVEATTVPTTFGSSLLQNLPSGHDPWSLVNMMPGATVATFDVAGDNSFQQADMQVHGNEPGQNVYSFNGLGLNWPGGNGGFAQFYINYSELQEFQVVTDTSSANVGPSGVFMNMVTKSGSNGLHGGASALYSTAAFQANPGLPLFNGSPVNTGTRMVHSLDASVDVGGPLLRNKLWWFASYRRYENRLDLLAVRRLTGQPVNDTNHQSNTTLRADYQLNSKNRLSFVWLYNAKNRFFRRDEGFSFVNDEAAWYQHLAVYILEGLWTSSLTNNLLMDVRFGYVEQRSPFDYQPTTVRGAISVRDITLSTLRGAAIFHELDRVNMKRFAAGFSYYKGAFLGGAHNLKFGVESGSSPDGDDIEINGDIYAIYNNGVPFEAEIFNTPVHELSIFHDTAAYVTDAWSLRRRLTLNLGFRYEHWRGFNPAQSSPATGNYVSFFPTRSFPETGVVDWNNFSPRAGVSLDLTGKGRSVLRFAYGRYYLLEGANLESTVNHNSLSGRTYLWNGASVNGRPDPAEFLTQANFVGASGGIVTRIDPNLKRPYSDEINVGYQQEAWGNLALGVNYYFRTNHELIAERNVAVPPSDYTSISTLKGQPITNPYTNQPLILYNVNPADVSLRDLVVTNVPALDDNRYDGVEFTATRRFSRRWQLLTGFTIQRKKGLSSSGLTDNFNDPNRDVNRANGYLGLDSTYVFKAAGTYDWPVGRLTTSLNFQHYTGYPLQPAKVFTGLNQGSETVALAPQGQLRLPSVDLLDLRISRPVKLFRERLTVEPIADLFNLLNNTNATSEVTTFGPNFLRPSNNIEPFVGRFGLQITF